MMQTLPLQTSQASPPARAADSFNASIASGQGTLVALQLELQTAPMQIEGITLPDEVLALIMRNMHESKDLLALTTSCQQFHAIYQDKRVYKAHERQYHILMNHLTTPALRQNLYAKVIARKLGNIAIPDPGTEEWKALREQPLNAQLRGEARQTALIKKMYILSWDLLLQPETLTHRLHASELMRLLLDLLPHIHYPEDYVAKLFGHGLDWDIFHQLAHCHLDRCVQLVAKHFTSQTYTPAYEFIVTHLPDNLLSLSFFGTDGTYLINNLRSSHIKSILFYILHYFEDGDPFRIRRDYHSTKQVDLLNILFTRGCDLEQTNKNSQTALMYLLNAPSLDYALINLLLQLGANCNASDKEGNTPLIKAYQLQDKELITLLLRQRHIDVNVRNAKGESALNIAIEKGAFATLQQLLQHPQIDVSASNEEHTSALYFAIEHNRERLVQNLLIYSKIEYNTCFSAFNYAIWQGKDDMFIPFLHGLDDEKRKLFILLALSASRKGYHDEVSKILYKKYEVPLIQKSLGIMII